MSCYEWEAGTITLPTKEAPRVRDAVKAAVTAHNEALYAHAQKFWKECPAAYKRDTKKYREAVSKYVQGNNGRDSWNPKDPKLPNWPGVGGNTQRHGLDSDLESLLGYTVMHKVVQKTVSYGNGQSYVQNNYVDTPPRRVQKGDVEKVTGKATGTKFRVNCGEPSITFDGRIVRWDVPENNHACDYGREHPIAQALFLALQRVTWTRGSGGKIIGNNEYNRDSEYEGGGGNYVVTEYGPKVARQPAYGRW